MASIQRRKGPNVVGFWGFLQPFADGFKLIIKEVIIPNKANKFLFVLAPGITLFLSFISW
jgi:NADH:ubiquinone oxidoreductase subunit H